MPGWEGAIESREGGAGRQAGQLMNLASLYHRRAFSCFLFCQYILIPGPVLNLLHTKTGLGRRLLPPGNLKFQEKRG